MHPTNAPPDRVAEFAPEGDRLPPPSPGGRNGQPATRPVSPRRRLGRWFALAAAGAAVLLGGPYLFSVFSAGRSADSARPAPSAAHPSEGAIREKTITPERVILKRSTSQPATVRALFEAKVSGRVPGHLKELRADIGDRVEEGQVLGVIDAPELPRRRERLKAEVDRWAAEETQARVEVETSEAFVRVTDAQVAQARAEGKKAQARLDAERAELRRIESIGKAGLIDQGVLNETRSRVQAAEAGVSAADSAVTAAEAGVEHAKAKHRLAKAAVESATARRQVAAREVEEVDVWIGYTRLLAPFRGVVTARGVDPGDLVGDPQKGGKSGPLFTVARVDRVRILVHLPERDAPWLDVGDAAEFRPEAFPGKSVSGTVARSAGALDPQTRTLAVEVELPNAEAKLLPGMYGQVTVVLEQRPGALVLPSGAVARDKAGTSRVYVLAADGAVRDVEVTTGLDDGHRVEVVRGLVGGERVVETPTAAMRAATPHP